MCELRRNALCSHVMGRKRFHSLTCARLDVWVARKASFVSLQLSNAPHGRLFESSASNLSRLPQTDGVLPVTLVRESTSYASRLGVEFLGSCC